MLVRYRMLECRVGGKGSWLTSKFAMENEVHGPG